jgi:hypothetical protein
VHERIEGPGHLETWENPGRRAPVSYAFDITTEIIDSQHGLPRVATRRHSVGTIVALNGESLSEGYYRLFTSDGEILKVKNVGLG